VVGEVGLYLRAAMASQDRGRCLTGWVSVHDRMWGKTEPGGTLKVAEKDERDLAEAVQIRQSKAEQSLKSGKKLLD
jgi:hypothetical protein